MARKWQGQAPTKYERLVAEAPAWTLYVMKTTGNWLNLKLVAKEKQENKANYWLGYNPKEQRFAKTRDQSLLEAHRPEVARWVVDMLNPGAAQPQQPATPSAPPPAPVVPPAAPEPVQDDSERAYGQRFTDIARRLMEEVDLPLYEPIPPKLWEKAMEEFKAETGRSHPTKLEANGFMRHTGGQTFIIVGDPHA